MCTYQSKCNKYQILNLGFVEEWVTFSYGANDNADRLVLGHGLGKSSCRRGVLGRIGHAHPPAAYREVVFDGILNDLEELDGRVGRLDAELVQQLDNQTGESLESSWNSGLWVDLDQNVLGRVDVHLRTRKRKKRSSTPGFFQQNYSNCYQIRVAD